tara:strand:+ start:55 stop:339 length:285 start_codon:yes stop_codon:yes gene_type:complete
MTIEEIGLFLAIFVSIYMNLRLTRELANHIQITAKELDANLAEALAKVVEELPLSGAAVNPWAGIVADIVKNNLNRDDKGRFVQAEILPPPTNE